MIHVQEIMAVENTFVADFNALTKDFWTNDSDYDQVHATLLRWKEDDLNIEPEVRRLQALFQDDFHFQVLDFLIPSQHPELKLQAFLNEVLQRHALARRSLTIFYYAGHADNIDKVPGATEWRA